MEFTPIEVLMRDGFLSGAEVGVGGESVRAEAIRELLLDAAVGPPGRVPALRLTGAHVMGALHLSSADIGCVLEFTDCIFIGQVDLSHSSFRSLHWTGCRFTDGLVLTGAQIALRVELTGSQLRRAPGEGDVTGFADYAVAVLDAERLDVGQDLLAEGLTAHGTVALAGCRIGRHLDLEEAQLLAPDVAITLDDAVIAGDLQAMRAGLNGAAMLSGLSVGGWADLRSVRCRHLDADRLTAGQGVNMTELLAEGTVNLTRSRIAGELVLVDARLTPERGEPALVARSALIDGDVLAEGIHASAVVSLAGSEVKGQVYFGLAQMSGLDCGRLVADGLEISGEQGPVNLVRARLGELVWQSPGPARLNGLTYDALVSEDLHVTKNAVRWIAGDPDGYSAQPYEQLAAFFSRSGRAHLARRVMLESRRVRRRLGPLHRRVVGWGVDLAAGYGYARSRAFVWMLIFWAIGAAWIAFGYHLKDPDPILSGLDVVLPASPFGLEEEIPAAVAAKNLPDDLRSTGRALLVVVQAAGYLLTIPLLASVTRAFNHN